MKILTHDEINLEFLSILDELDRFCEKHNLKYYLMWGSLLGAVRHQGFIPWDDDVDVCMPRTDYERFIEIYNRECNGKFQLIHFSQQKEVNRRLAFLTTPKIGLRRHGVNSKSAYDCLGIDIFPIDYINDNNALKRFQEIRMTVWQYIYAIKSIDILAKRSTFKRVIICTTRFLTAIIPMKYTVCKCDRLAKAYTNHNSKRVGIYAIKTYGRYMIFDSEDFHERLSVKFEDRSYYIPKGYDHILKIIYGNYMVPPPEDKRTPHNPYDEYYVKDNF